MKLEKQPKKTSSAIIFTAALAMLAPDVARADLVGHWKFDDGAGATAVDSSVNGNDATNAGGGAWVVGKAGGAYEQPRFLVDPSDEVQFAGTVSFSVSLWVKQESVGNHMLAGIDGFSTGGSDDMYSLKMVDDKVRWYLKGVTAGVDSTDTLTSYAAATADGWVHVVGVYEPGVSSRLYINGALNATGSGGGAISDFPDPFGMGRYYNNLSGTLDGAIDDVQVYDQALSGADVATLYGNPGFPLGAGPSTVTMGPPSVSAITDDGATVECQLFNDDADDVTVVWAESDAGETDVSTWMSADGGGSHPFGGASQDEVLSRAITGLDGDTTYFFRFFATAGGDSDWSEPGSFATGLGDSPAPADFAGTPGTSTTGTKVDLSWTDGYTHETGYVIRRSTDPGFGSFDEFLVGADETSFSDDTTDPSTTYYYRIAAEGTSGTGSFSANLEVTTGDAPAAGLIAHWKFDDGSGSTAVDSSGNGNDATNAGGGSWVTGKAGGAYDQPRFTVDPSDDVQFAGTVSFSVSLWVKQESVGNHMLAGIDGFSTGGSDDMYALKMVSDNVVWYLKGVGTFTSTDTLTNYAAATADGWVHVVGVYEPGVSSRLYINGALDNTGSGGGAISDFPDPFGMGRYYNNLSGVLDGALDDVQVYNLALSADDAAFLYNNPGSIIGEATAPFAITEIEYDAAAEPFPTVTLTWRKTGAATYIARLSRDLGNWDEDLDDSITAEEDDENTEDTEHITVTFQLKGDRANAEGLFFRIEEG